MRRRLRSLRVRVALSATLAVTAALVAAALGLVLTVERTLLGRLRAQAIERMDAVADAIAVGRSPQVETDEPPDVLVQVLDENGDVVEVVPEAAPFSFSIVDGNATDTAPPPVAPLPGLDLAPVEGTIVRQLDAEELILAQRSVESPDGDRTIVAISPFSGVSRSVDTVVTTLWIGTPVLIAVVAFVSWHFAGRTLGPVDAMTRRAEEISHSTLGGRLPRPGTHDEVDRLALTLNSMLERLDGAARRQREFVSDASHELRSPIAAIRAQLEVALAHPDAASWEEAAEGALAETARLERLVGDLLALARAEERVLGREPVDVVSMVEELIERAGDARVTLEARAARVDGDRDLLDRALANLLDNARRHARDRVHVSVTPEPSTVVVTVDDDGPGIPEHERVRVFERFRRLEEGRRRDRGGVGIGLSVVARVAESHDGSVRCLASRLGGARFELRLPRSDP